MGTRSAIGYATTEGRIRAKYSHYDGYPAYTGKMLQEHYRETSKIVEMVELGDQSVLAPEIVPKGPHSFDSPEEGVTIFYGRDRGETGVEPREFESLEKFVEHFADCWCEYFYIYAHGEWMMNSANDKKGWRLLGKVPAAVAA